MTGKRLIIIFLILTTVAVLAHAVSRRGHDFSSTDCTICHVDEIADPQNMKAPISSACETCHPKLREMQTHPTDVLPTMPIPADMVLSNGMLTCLSCHYVHPEKRTLHFQGSNFLRRNISGRLFCGICHEIDDKQHIIPQDVHTGHYEKTDISTRLDRISLDCIECHVEEFNFSDGTAGADFRQHFGRATNHPIGISYMNESMRKPEKYKAVSGLNKAIRLFEGKIGCGTCHNIYSTAKNMLVMGNRKSRLCMQCHNK